MTPPLRIAIAGKRHSGKDTAADALCAQFPSLQKVKLTDPVYALGRSWGMVGKDRRLLQRAGDHLRATYGQNALTTHLILRSMEGSWVCPDLRLPDEGKLLRAAGWIVLRIERPEEARLASLAAVGEALTGAEAEHRTETSVDAVPVDLVVPNDGTVEDLAKRVVAAVREVAARRGVRDISELRGIGKDWFGDEPSEVYVRRLWGGEDEDKGLEGLA